MSMESIFLLASIFSLSLFGSWHCGLMCGPFSVSLTSGLKERLIGYHLGRLISYVSLGALAGHFGFLFSFSDHILAKSASGALLTLLGFGFVYYVSKVLRINPASKRTTNSFLNRFDDIYRKLLVGLYKKPFSSFLFGLLSIVLPCGWLYGFVFAASATKSSSAGALVMFAFWLGGLPILTVVPRYFHSSLRRIPPRAHNLFKSLIFGAALLSWTGFYWG